MFTVDLCIRVDAENTFFLSYNAVLSKKNKKTKLFVGRRSLFFSEKNLQAKEKKTGLMFVLQELPSLAHLHNTNSGAGRMKKKKKSMQVEAAEV